MEKAFTVSNSAVIEKWKLCTIGGFLGFFVFALLLTSNRSRVDELWVARSSTVTTTTSMTSATSDVSNLPEVDRNLRNSTSSIAAKSEESVVVTASNSAELVAPAMVALPPPPPPAPLVIREGSSSHWAPPSAPNYTHQSGVDRNLDNNSTDSKEPIAATTTTNFTELKKPMTLPPSSPPPPLVFTREAAAVASSPVWPPSAPNHGDAAGDGKMEEQKSCNIFEGRWVYEPNYRPSYGEECPFHSVATHCQRNGRPDSDYQGWIWQPNDCDLPRFNGRDTLERLRGKRVILVGDSLNHNQWQSLACLIYTSISPSRRLRTVQISAGRSLRVKDYDFSLEFHQSPFLVHLEEKHPSGRRVLHLDKIDPTSKLWRGADVVVFNSAHWWGHGPDIRVWDVYEHNGELTDNMSKEEAYGHALATWSRWVTKKIDPKKTTVFFRSDSPQHGGKLWCFNATRPIPDDAFMPYYPKSMVEVAEKSVLALSRRFPVKYLNITWLSGYRRDAHPAMYVQPEPKWRAMLDKVQTLERVARRKSDCSHWCLPGLPDTWNRLLYASLFFGR